MVVFSESFIGLKLCRPYNDIWNQIYLTCYSNFAETLSTNIFVHNIHVIVTLTLSSIVYLSLFDPYKYAPYMLFLTLCPLYTKVPSELGVTYVWKMQKLAPTPE